MIINKHVTVDRQKPVDATNITQITHDTNSEVEFPALETDEDVETPPDSLGNEFNPIIHQTEECSICLNDLYVKDNTPGGELCVLKECQRYCHKHYLMAFMAEQNKDGIKKIPKCWECKHEFNPKNLIYHPV